jgi:hypothetical protein
LAPKISLSGVFGGGGGGAAAAAAVELPLRAGRGRSSSSSEEEEEDSVTDDGYKRTNITKPVDSIWIRISVGRFCYEKI